MNRLRFALSLLLLAGCASPGPMGPGGDTLELTNTGKDDSATVRVRLTEASPFAGMAVGCEAIDGCTGWVEVQVQSPDGCALSGDARCGVVDMGPAAVELGTLTVRSATEGERTLPLRMETADGMEWTTSVAAGFTAMANEEIAFDLEKASGVADLTVAIRAHWEDTVDLGARQLEEYLATVPGLVFREIGTGFQGYRAYELWLLQPLDHEDPTAGEFYQRAILHHIDQAAPMVLYTSGYALFVDDFLSELTNAMGANQLDTEQRMFGNSFPDAFQPEQWQYVTIRQAAADHHRFVEALRPFYEATWLSTGHSKGGMTSIFHRRFYPNDVHATVAYVAPISFAPRDPRYVPFLDAIGTDECRGQIRELQQMLIDRFDEVQPALEAEAAMNGFTFDESGGHAIALQETILMFEWGFWQGQGINECPALPDRASIEMGGLESVLAFARERIGYGSADQFIDPVGDAYAYQAATELGYQEFATDHLGELRHGRGPWFVPSGTMPVHDPAAMEDIQRWVNEEGNGLVFLYGEHDPWTGGAYETPTAEGIVRVTVAGANHGALIAGLDTVSRGAVLDAVEQWMGVRPALDEVLLLERNMLPPRLLREGLSPR